MIDKDMLLDQMSAWNSAVEGKIRLIACGGTAMTLIGVKPSTKDIDFMVPDVKEYEKLINTLERIGYKPAKVGHGLSREEGINFDLFPGNSIHTTNLLYSPLDPGRNIPLKQYSHISVGILNYYDLIASKLFRGDSVDFSDCELLAEKKKSIIDFKRLETDFKELASYDTTNSKDNELEKRFEFFKNRLKDKGIAYTGKETNKGKGMGM